MRLVVQKVGFGPDTCGTRLSNDTHVLALPQTYRAHIRYLVGRGDWGVGIRRISIVLEPSS